MRIIILLLISTCVYAQQNDCEPEKFRVVFSNGELTTPKQAFTALNELALNLGNSHADQGITYDLAYNYSVDAFKKLLQSSDQRLWYVDLARLVYNWKYQVNTPELNEHVEKYREAILHGQKVLVVSHSQGNFNTNLARQMLANRKPAIAMESFGIFGVATPANHVGGSGTYLTNHLDIITSVPSSSPANWALHRIDSGKIVDNIGSISAHSFSDTYLSPYYDIRPEVVRGIKQELGKLKEPPQVVKSGSVTVTLTWNLGNGNDVDLYVFEPDKTHVYFGSKTGNSGYLDVDSRQGFGPEHYYTDCKKLPVGEYLVGVKYFSDSSTPARQVTATVTISTPGSTRTFITKLGNATPTSPNFVKLAKVVIDQISDPTGMDRRLKYQIVPMLAPAEKMLPIGANDYQAWFDRGQKFVELGRFEEAIESYDKVLQIKPDHSVAWNERGIVLSNLGRYQEAIESYDKTLQIRSDHYVAWNNRGIAFYYLGRYQKAIESFDKTLQIKPNYYLTWSNRGNMLSILGHYQEAIESFDKSLRIKPDYKFAKDGRNNALTKLKQQ